MDVKIFGIVKLIDGSKTKIAPSFQKKSDRIHIFLNYTKVGEFLKKEDAQKKIEELIKNSPENLDLFFEYLKI